MSDKPKIKLYKNPERNKATNPKPYVPQYQIEGVEPQEYRSPTSPGYTAGAIKKAPLSRDNPRAPRPLMRQPYAEPAPSPVGNGKGLLPNVGNHIEQTWSGVDADIVDDISLDPNQSMVDNNDFVSAAALGLPEDEAGADPSAFTDYSWNGAEYVPNGAAPNVTSSGGTVTFEDELENPEEKNFLSENELQNILKEQFLSKIIGSLEEDDYLLLLGGEAICSGALEEVQEQARALIFGEHPSYNDTPIPVDDILIIKRVKVKIGLFLE